MQAIHLWCHDQYTAKVRQNDPMLDRYGADVSQNVVASRWLGVQP